MCFINMASLYQRAQFSFLAAAFPQLEAKLVCLRMTEIEQNAPVLDVDSIITIVIRWLFSRGSARAIFQSIGACGCTRVARTFYLVIEGEKYLFVQKLRVRSNLA